jgi:ABC-type transporter Mla subunit MlaD
MSSKPHYFAIGLFVLIGIALGIVGIISFSSDAMRDPSLFMETYVDESVQGIDVGTPFKFRGVKIGSVHEIKIVIEEYKTDKMYIMIRVAIDENLLSTKPEEFSELVIQQVARGMRIKIVPQGITGLAFLDADLYPEGLTEPLPIDWEPTYGYIPSTPSMMAVLSKSLERITADINSLDLVAMGENIESITSNLNASAQDISKITHDTADISDEVMKNVKTASSDLTAMVTDVRATVLDSDANIEQILTNLRYITEETRELIRMIKRTPSMLLTEPPEKKLSR